MTPQLIFGTASFGMEMTNFQDGDSVRNLLQALQKAAITILDTGARYPPLNHGRSESLIGEVRDLSESFVVDTKVFTDTRKDGGGDLSRQAVERSIEGSLQRLRRKEGVNVLYAHRADPTTPLEEQIQAFNEQIVQGKCKAWGISNTPIDTLRRILELCEQHGWKKPSCYQGPYNIVTRGMESELLPILRAHDISFVAYQALAAGFLTGKFLNNQFAGTRLDEANPLGGIVQKMFGAEDVQLAVKEFEASVDARGLAPLEVAIRWLAHHSDLREHDAVIIGASKTAQFIETFDLIRKGPLPDEVLPVTERLWDAVRESRCGII